MKQMNLFSKSLIDDNPFVEEEIKKSKEKVKIVDLFAGVGGFHYGISAAASKLNKGVKAELVSEIEETCKQVYSNNFGVEVLGDINKIALSDFKNISADIVTAGFPCQPFSNSGKKLGLSDHRGQFYFRIEEIIKHFKAKSFILENVTGLKTNGGGQFKSKLSYTPSIIGNSMNYMEENLLKLKDYSIKWIELDSSKFGSPQVRKRVYIIGIHKDFTKNLELEFNSYVPKPFINIAEKEVNEDLLLNINQLNNLKSFMKEPPSFMNGMRRVGNAYLCKGGNVGQGYHAYGMVPTLTVVWAKFLPIYFPHKNENLPNINNKEFIPNKFYGLGDFRKASVRETATLQGFPMSYTPHFNKNTAYEHSGNAVNAKVVREISDNIFRYIF
jgi:DNA (cytosine-5)-methyltransferase 1